MIIYASTTNLTAGCPLCKQLSRRIQGCYARTLADLPWCGTPVRLRVRVRKFFCDVASYERRVFAESLKDVARAYARGTDRQREALEWIAFALGGKAGARLARKLGLIVSPDTLLNRIRGASRADAEDVRVLDVDDFGLGRDNAPRHHPGGPRASQDSRSSRRTFGRVLGEVAFAAPEGRGGEPRQISYLP